MIDIPNEAYKLVRIEPSPLPPQVVDAPFLITDSERRARRINRRRRSLLKAIRRLVEIGLKAKGK